MRDFLERLYIEGEMTSKVRVLKIAAAVSRAVSEIFYSDFGVTILIFDVKVSNDLRYSDIFLYKENSISMDELDKISGLLQYKLTKYLNLRYALKVRFHATDVALCSDPNFIDQCTQ